MSEFEKEDFEKGVKVIIAIFLIGMLCGMAAMSMMGVLT